MSTTITDDMLDEQHRLFVSSLDKLSAELREVIRQRDMMEDALEECVDLFETDLPYSGALLIKCRRALGEVP